MTPRNLLEVPDPWPRVTRSWNAQLIPKYLQALALAGIYYDSRIIEMEV